MPRTPAQIRNDIRAKKTRVVLVFREVSPNPGIGATKTIVSIVKSENQRDVTKLCKRFIKPGSTIWTDKHHSFNRLNSLGFHHHAVEHRKEFMTRDGVHNNQAESFFSRLRRSELGTFHGMRNKYLIDYAQEAAWKEDTRKMSLKTQLILLIQQIFTVGESAWWRGYYQGYKRNDELMNF